MLGAAEASPPTHVRDAPAVVDGFLPVGDLLPHPKNPRDHDADENARRAREIVRTTWGAPILVQASTRRIIDGHGRWESAKLILAGLEVDGVRRGGPDWCFRRGAPPGLVPVSILDVDDVTADALRVMANAEGLQGRDDPARLLAMLEQFGRGSELLNDMGFDPDALDALAAEAEAAVAGLGAVTGGEREPVTEDEPEVDRADELREKWGTELGQLWEIPSAKFPGGVHRILCGDSTKAAAVARVLAGELARWSWTDPPYGVEYKGGTGLTIENDGAAGLPELLRGAFTAMDAHLVEGAPIYVAHPSGPLSFVFAEEWKRVGWKWHQTLAWVKNTFVLGHSDYHHQHEPILYGWKGKNRPWYAGRDKSSTLFFDKPARNAEHPTMKPVGLVAECVQNSSRRGDRGFEPFSGSGTTLAAAEQTGRLVSAIELAPKYVAVALERMATMGLAPRLAA